MAADDCEKCVQLKRSDSYGFGFSILGGSGSELPPVIYEIIENSPAAASGQLEAGDVILEVNDKEVFTLTTKEVLKCLRLSSDLVTLKLKRDPKIQDKVKAYLSASSNDMDKLKQAIQQRDDQLADGEIIPKKSKAAAVAASPNRKQLSTASVEATNGHSQVLHSKEDIVAAAAANNGVNDDSSVRLDSTTPRTPPRFETFMMTGELILNLNAKASGGSNIVGPMNVVVTPKMKRTPEHQQQCLMYGQSSTPASPEDGESRSGRSGKGTKRESPSLCSPVADKKAAFGYGGNFVRTSRSEDHLQKDYLTMVNIDIDDDITSSLNTLLDTNPANDRIVWTYNAPVSQDSASSSPHSSSPSSPPQSPTYRPLRSPSPPTKPSSPKRKAPLPPYSPSPSPSPSPTSGGGHQRRGDEQRFFRDSSGEAASSSTISDDQQENVAPDDLETDDSADGSSPRPRTQHLQPLQNGLASKTKEQQQQQQPRSVDDPAVVAETKVQSSRGRRLESKLQAAEQSTCSRMMSRETAMTFSMRDSGEDGVDVDSCRATGGGSRLDNASKCVSPPPDSDDSDIESLHSFHYSPKAVDMPSASRLAKRLYYLEGFKKSDVSRHLSKNNEFSRVVAEEYLKFFEFTGDMLDLALRKFLRQFCLTGETQERERVLVHFSKRFLDCNPGSFNSQDAVHTLTCALMLLNTDLHGQNIGRKMTCAEFIDNLSELNDGENFPKDVLKALYHSIKSQPLEWAVDDEEIDDVSCTQEIQRRTIDDRSSLIGHNPFLEVPNVTTATEYKKGYVMRKCCIEPNGKRTPLGKRGWKMFYTTLKDLVLYLHKDEHGFKKNQLYDNLHNCIRIHHALATKATDYTKKQHVFRLQTSEWAEYLFQTSDSKELQSWIDTINFVAASLSAPPLAGAVGSQRRFQRPLLPCSHTKLNMREQLQDHEDRVVALEREVEEHRLRYPEKGSKSRALHEYQEKETYLQYELRRYKTYAYLLRSKMAQHHEFIVEPSLVETFIGEVDERDIDATAAVAIAVATTGRVTAGGDYHDKDIPRNSDAGLLPVVAQHGYGRNMADRYSYRAAIYSSNKSENCV